MVETDTDAFSDETEVCEVENFVPDEPDDVSGEMTTPASWF